MKKTITTIVAAAMALALIHTVSCSKTEADKEEKLANSIKSLYVCIIDEI